MNRFESGIMRCIFINNYPLDLNRHHEPGSGSIRHLDSYEMLKQVQHDAQKLQYDSQRYKTLVNRHPELVSGSQNKESFLDDVFLNQVQNDAQSIQPQINIKVVRLSGVEAL